ALRHRSCRSREVVNARERLVVLGRDLSLLELPPRASLLSKRPVLQPAAPAEGPRPVLREARLHPARLRRAHVELARTQPPAALEVGERPLSRAQRGIYCASAMNVRR